MNVKVYLFKNLKLFQNIISSLISEVKYHHWHVKFILYFVIKVNMSLIYIFNQTYYH